MCLHGVTRSDITFSSLVWKVRAQCLQVTSAIPHLLMDMVESKAVYNSTWPSSGNCCCSVMLLCSGA